MYSFEDLSKAINHVAVLQMAKTGCIITQLATDSRAPVYHQEAIFFAIDGKNNKGSTYIKQMYAQGCRCFIVSHPINFNEMPEGNFLQVENVVSAMQQVVTFHRSHFDLTVVGITGSNGKTIVKEWAAQLLAEDFAIVKSPASYNSQIGVPLSVWQLNERHTLGIFEAGISQPDEMLALETVIKPSIGIITNLGAAHDEGFANRLHKAQEKVKLFRNCKTIILDGFDTWLLGIIQRECPKAKLVPWLSTETQSSNELVLKWDNQVISFQLPFSDKASRQNAAHAIVLALELGSDKEMIQQRLFSLRNQPMRLELKKGSNNCYIIDDSYNNDMQGLNLALDFLAQQPGASREKVAIITEPAQTNLSPDLLHATLAKAFQQRKVNYVLFVGSQGFAYAQYYKAKVQFHPDVEDLIEWLREHPPVNKVLLIKGARNYQLERVVNLLQEKQHGTIMEINLNALLHNFHFYKRILPLGTKIMVMVKALAYGSGSFEVANLLQYHGADYLAVAYLDEAIELRRQGITMPIMVMNADARQVDSFLHFNLEPAVYSIPMLQQLNEFIAKSEKQLRIHLEFDTGMKRLGLETEQVQAVIQLLKNNKGISVAGVFSHLVAADEQSHDNFTQWQIDSFYSLAVQIEEGLGYATIKHILNSAGITRFTHYAGDMVRLGIGLYGIEVGNNYASQLNSVATLKTNISQIRTAKAGQSVGYGRKGMLSKESRIATLAVGYADGYSRANSNGVGKVWINGHTAPVIGNVCMDMTMVDLGAIPCKEGDEAILFGEQLPITQVAIAVNTIPYEVLSNVSGRVKRVFVKD